MAIVIDFKQKNNANKIVTTLFYVGFANLKKCFFFLHFLFYLDRQLNFSRSRRYSLVNRLSPTTQIACNLETIDDGYFSIILAANSKVLGVRLENSTANVDVQVANGNELQQWDIIPTGEADYYRIKTASRRVGQMDFLFLQVPLNDSVHLDLDRRQPSYFGQQWRIV